MNKMYRILLILFASFLIGCSGSKNIISVDSNIVNITFLQMNDVYEISPLENGKVGGLARVATIRKRLLSENPNTYTVLAGDFLSPSLIGTLRLDGERIRGAHMVDVLNTLGLDLVCFGNHEFDIGVSHLQERIDESEFDWISGNIKQIRSKGIMPFEKIGEGPIPEYKIFYIPNSDVKVGVFTVCLPANKQDYLHYDDIFETADRLVKILDEKTDIVVGLTHIDAADDIELANRFPEIDLIMGGHDHANMQYGRGNATIAKADANAKTVYVHRMTFNRETQELKISSELVKVTDAINDDVKTKNVVDDWVLIAARSFAELGFDPNEILSVLSDPYDAREATIRFKPAPFCQMIARAMLAASPKSEAAIINSGSVRVDDVLTGNLTQYDVLRSLPFGGGFVDVELKGNLLKKILDTGWNNVDNGGFLQWTAIDREKEQWLLNGKPIADDEVHRVSFTDFLLIGYESNMDYLTAENPGIVNVYKDNRTDNQKDIRNAVIHYLKNGGR